MLESAAYQLSTYSLTANGALAYSLWNFFCDDLKCEIDCTSVPIVVPVGALETAVAFDTTDGALEASEGTRVAVVDGAFDITEACAFDTTESALIADGALEALEALEAPELVPIADGALETLEAPELALITDGAFGGSEGTRGAFEALEALEACAFDTTESALIADGAFEALEAPMLEETADGAFDNGFVSSFWRCATL